MDLYFQIMDLQVLIMDLQVQILDLQVRIQMNLLAFLEEMVKYSTLHMDLTNRGKV